MRSAVLLVALLFSAGCLSATHEGAGPGTGDGKGGVPAGALGEDGRIHAPWWNLGESWTITFERAGEPPRTSTLVNFANDSWDPHHFWLGVRDRDEALRHVFFDDNPFLGRIHWILLAPHERGMHAAMYKWPLQDGSTWQVGTLLGTEDVVVRARAQPDGTFDVRGSNGNGIELVYDYDPETRWFRELSIVDNGRTTLSATVTEHRDSGATGTFHFLRGRDYLDSAGGTTGQTQRFSVADEGATSIAFLLDVRTNGPTSIEFVAPDGEVWHRETLPTGGASDKLVEVKKTPPPGEWQLRFLGSVEGRMLVRGIIEYKASL